MDDDEQIRAVYDHGAERYLRSIGTTISPEIEDVSDLDVLERFAGLFDVTIGPVLDAGCGPGRAAAYLDDRGITTVGIDLSEQLLRAGRRTHPTIASCIGSIRALPFGDRTFAGVVAWYSIIHTSADALTAVYGELARVTHPGAPVLLAFHAGAGERRERHDAQGSGVTLTTHLHDPDRVVGDLERTGFTASAAIRRPARRVHEHTPQAFVIASRHQR
ncbi:MAG: class I SAM-dependent methyltransferase [Microthrixaceae bacterium]